MEDQPAQPLPNPNTKDEKLECLMKWGITVPPFVDTEHPEQVHSFYISCHKFIHQNPTSFDPAWVTYMAAAEFNNPAFALKRATAHEKAADDQNASEDDHDSKEKSNSNDNLSRKTSADSSDKLMDKPSPATTKQTAGPKEVTSVKPIPNKLKGISSPGKQGTSPDKLNDTWSPEILNDKPSPIPPLVQPPQTTEQTTEPEQKLKRIPEKLHDTLTPDSLNEKPSSTTTLVSESPQQTKQTTESKKLKSVKPSPPKNKETSSPDTSVKSPDNLSDKPLPVTQVANKSPQAKKKTTEPKKTDKSKDVSSPYTPVKSPDDILKDTPSPTTPVSKTAQPTKQTTEPTEMELVKPSATKRTTARKTPSSAKQPKIQSPTLTRRSKKTSSTKKQQSDDDSFEDPFIVSSPRIATSNKRKQAKNKLRNKSTPNKKLKKSSNTEHKQSRYVINTNIFCTGM